MSQRFRKATIANLLNNQSCLGLEESRLFWAIDSIVAPHLEYACWDDRPDTREQGLELLRVWLEAAEAEESEGEGKERPG